MARGISTAFPRMPAADPREATATVAELQGQLSDAGLIPELGLLGTRDALSSPREQLPASGSDQQARQSWTY